MRNCSRFASFLSLVIARNSGQILDNIKALTVKLTEEDVLNDRGNIPLII